MKKKSIESILPFDIRDEDLLFHVFTTTSPGVTEFPEVYFPSQVKGLDLCICLSGEAQMSIDQKCYVIREREMFVMLPGVVVRPISRSDDYVGYVLRLEPNWSVDIDSSAGLPFYMTVRDNPCLSLTEDDMQTLLELCDLVKKRAKRGDHPYRKEMAEHLILTIFYEISAICQRGQPLRQRARRRQEELFEKFLYLVTTYFHTQRGLDFYAERMCLTPKYLSSIVKQSSGASATEWIIHSVIREAKSLLETSQLTVQQVADHLHFPTPSFFGQYFKKHVGMTPKEYRLKNKR